jgi:EmrB/QacA subfamily drug resistance transporter
MLIAVLCATFLGSLDTFIVNIALPSIERALHASFAQIQLVVAGYTLAFAVLLVTGGRLGDLYGRKRFFVLGVAGFTLFSALCGAAPTPLLLIVCRIAQGIAAALMVPQVIPFLQLSFEPNERPLVFGISVTVGGLASILGQVGGGWLLAANLFNLGWRSLFLVNVPIGVFALLAALVLLRESHRAHIGSLDCGGATLLSLSLAFLVFPLVLGAGTGWPLWSLICLILCMPCMIAFFIYEDHLTRQGKLSLVSPILLRQRRFLSGLLTNLLANVLFAGYMFLLSFYLQIILRYTPLQAGSIFLASSMAFLLASGLSPLLSTHLKRWWLSVAAALVPLGYLCMLLAVQWLVPLWGIAPLLVALCTLGSGMGSLVTQLAPRAFAEVAPGEVGAASGLYTTATQMAAALGIAVIGLIFATLKANHESELHAFVLSLLLILFLSFGLSCTVLPLRKEREL